MSNTKQQTAVDYFWNQLSEILPYSVDTETGIKLDRLYRECKEREREQIEDAFEESRLTHPWIGFKHDTFIEYYEKSYGK